MLLFVPLAPWYPHLRYEIDTLVDIYNAIHPTHPIEVVFIGFEVPIPQRSPLRSYIKSSQEYFQNMFSIMPWTAIPFSHNTNSLDYWRTRLGYPLYPPEFATDIYSFSLVIDPTGVVLQLGADNIFVTFGAEAYPFSDKRVSYLEQQDKKALHCPSITRLLTSPGHDHVINCDNKEVPVKDLQGKTVALYFYQDCHQSFQWFTKKLKDAYDDLMPAKKGEFEVVLVFIHNSHDALGFASEKSFWNALYTMPWFALPFKHPRVQNLQRIFEFSNDSDLPPVPRLVIIGPRGNFVEPYGADIVEHFGVKAYPFTRREAVKIEVDNIKTLKLDMFLDPNTSLLQDGSKVKLSQTAGKKIILIVEAGSCIERLQFWKRLTKRYHRLKKMGDPFEVIHVPNKDTSSSSSVPWLRGPPFPENSDKRGLVFGVFRNAIGLVAFDGDGTVVRKTGYPHIQNKSVCFPFNDHGLEKEALKDLIQVFKWDDSELVRGF